MSWTVTLPLAWGPALAPNDPNHLLSHLGSPFPLNSPRSDKYDVQIAPITPNYYLLQFTCFVTKWCHDRQVLNKCYRCIHLGMNQ